MGSHPKGAGPGVEQTWQFLRLGPGALTCPAGKGVLAPGAWKTSLWMCEGFQHPLGERPPDQALQRLRAPGETHGQVPQCSTKRLRCGEQEPRRCLSSHWGGMYT